MIVKYDEENFSIKLYRDFVKGKLVGLMEVIPIDELLEVWADRKTEPTISKMEQVEDEPQITMDCSKCERYKDGGELCDFCAIKDEPQTMYYPQVDGITPSVIVKDEPQTERSE